ncbi:ComEC/Rec2 family competence protein [Sphingomonas yantingensis]|uniref:Competence protein ComEC n=1 Tax=Sphingomonas yantingensis TaxID=1241761 RepID=A0A7W9ASH6_9SPHN|nr:ComEC/Rec2 family competence protein [Sphingomonas yantingensis]MBB5699574.1 competence protein ComEC [Sphingomonas yantingensis]
MASRPGGAPSTHPGTLQIGAWRPAFNPWPPIERWLEAERDQLPLWLPVALGGGMTAWLVLPWQGQWAAFVLLCLAMASTALALGRGGRSPRMIAVGALAAALGCALIWWRAERVAAPVLARPAVVDLAAPVERIERLPARGIVRLTLASGRGDLPPRVRVNVDATKLPTGIAIGSRVTLKARLMPPAAPAVPGAYDFARVAWFSGLGATGTSLSAVKAEGAGGEADGLRDRLTRHIHGRVEGSAGGIAAALVTGDRGAIAPEDDEALRRAGLAHLLSVSGLHVTAVVGATMLVALRLLALFPVLAIRFRLPVVAALIAAGVAGFYTWLTGAEVPTVRSLVAALIVLAALALGREAITLRLVAAGALIVLVLWPEAIASASFQLSFAAVTAIVALHESSMIARWFGPREEGRGWRLLRGLGSLLLTGLVIELVLMPIGLFHFHKAGLYGSVANLVAIPLTTFVVMPAEALALVLDAGGLGAPVWWVVEVSLKGLLWLSHTVASAPGSVAALPTMPNAAFALMVAGGLWIALWRTRWRWFGALPFALGGAMAVAAPTPELIVTGDGRHVAIRGSDGSMRVLRERAGEYVRGILGEAAGIDGELGAIDDAGDARCSRDACTATLTTGGRRWRVAATRSFDLIPIAAMIRLCRTSDIVISDRRLPRGCNPRWLRLDRPMLAKTGGVSIDLDGPRVTRVSRPGDQPWLNPVRVAPPRLPRPRRSGTPKR